jgi:hypothetical protein
MPNTSPATGFNHYDFQISFASQRGFILHRLLANP